MLGTGKIEAAAVNAVFSQKTAQALAQSGRPGAMKPTPSI